MPLLKGHFNKSTFCVICFGGVELEVRFELTKHTRRITSAVPLATRGLQHIHNKRQYV